MTNEEFMTLEGCRPDKYQNCEFAHHNMILALQNFIVIVIINQVHPLSLLNHQWAIFLVVILAENEWIPESRYLKDKNAFLFLLRSYSGDNSINGGRKFAMAKENIMIRVLFWDRRVMVQHLGLVAI